MLALLFAVLCWAGMSVWNRDSLFDRFFELSRDSRTFDLDPTIENTNP